MSGEYQPRRVGVDISIVIVNWNTREFLLDCLESVFRTIHDITFETWLVDNASTDGSVEAVESHFQDVNIIKNPRNLGFAAANNVAFKKIRGRYALLLNTDTILTDGAVKELYDFMEATPQAGLACGQLLNLDGTKQNSIANFPSLISLLTNETLLRILIPGKFPSKRQEYTSPLEVESCIGACMLARKKAMDDIGFLDDRFFFFFEETDWAYRMKKAHWEIYYIPTAGIYHAQGQSVGRGIQSRITFYRSRYIYFKKWHPCNYVFYNVAIFLRLLFDTFLALFGSMATLGLNQHIRNKLVIYLNLILWHFQGCPPNE